MNQWGIKVVPHDTAYRFLASSRTRVGDHMVDLTANKNLGDCACENFRFKRIIQFGAAGETVDDKYRCDHIRACREELLNDFLSRLIEDEQLRQKPRSTELPENDETIDPKAPDEDWAPF